MVNKNVVKRLFEAFPNAIINRLLEFVADVNPRVNSYFTLDGVSTEIEVSCKLLEWLSRNAYKSEHYRKAKDNNRVHEYHLNGINAFLRTNFTHEDMKLIYCELGNCVNHELTIKFVESGYDMRILREVTE